MPLWVIKFPTFTASVKKLSKESRITLGFESNIDDTIGKQEEWQGTIKREEGEKKYKDQFKDAWLKWPNVSPHSSLPLAIFVTVSNLIHFPIHFPELL